MILQVYLYDVLTLQALHDSMVAEKASSKDWDTLVGNLVGKTETAKERADKVGGVEASALAQVSSVFDVIEGADADITSSQF